MPTYNNCYTENDLKKGKCKSCGEISEEILIGDNRCVDCINEQAFFEMTMKKHSEDDDEF